MKRYWLFGGEAYYPGGGAEDYQADHDDQDRLARLGRTFLREGGTWKWAHIWDAVDKAIVWSSNSDKERG